MKEIQELNKKYIKINIKKTNTRKTVNKRFNKNIFFILLIK